MLGSSLLRWNLVAAALVSALVIGTAASPAHAQTQRDHPRIAAELQRLYTDWRISKDPEQRLGLAEQALKLEADLPVWNLSTPRDRLKVSLWFSVGYGYAARKHGDRADNLAKAISAYEAALAAAPKSAAPEYWGPIHHNLGLAYYSSPGGNKADNIEKSIAAFEEALTARKREVSPKEWANTLFRLAISYKNRERGDRSENSEKAIALLEAALSARTREADPAGWAEVHEQLSHLIRERVSGSRADNVERSLEHMQAALSVTTKQSNPQAWGRMMHSLAIAYYSRFKGERADNIEKAIEVLEQALAVRTRESAPEAWAVTMQVLALCYGQRVRGSRAENLEKQIAAIHGVLSVFTRERDPMPWSGLQLNLAYALRNRLRGERADNLEKAKEAIEAALTVRTREAKPEDWAQTQRALGTIYRDRVHGDAADNLEKAIAAYRSALEVLTPEVPMHWSHIQLELAVAYAKRIRGDRADNLAKAIAANEAALKVITLEYGPRSHLRGLRQLGGALLETGDWLRAGQVLADARATFAFMFGEGLDDAEAQYVIAEAGPIFAEAALAAVERGAIEEGFGLASEGRAHLMAVALRLQSLDLPNAERQRLEELRTAIREASGAYDETSGPSRGPALDKQLSLRRDMHALLRSAASRTEATAATALAAAWRTVPAGGAVVVPVVTRVGGKLFVLAEGKRLTVVDLPELTSGRVDELMQGDGSKTGARGGWLGAFNVQYLPEDEKGARIGEWTGAIEGIGGRLWDMFAARLDATLAERGIKPGARIVWLPTGALGLLPLGLAAQNGGVPLMEKYELVAAPSLQALAAATRQAEQGAPLSLAAVVNPTGEDPALTLPFTEVEGALVTRHFAGRPLAVLDKTNAAPAAVLSALKGKSYWHFSSHGAFDWDDPRRAGLIMRGGQTLTIGALLEAESALGRPRLVVLSACETGLYDTSRNADEFIGLPATLMQVGATGVLGTLWQVDDLATSLIMAKFYDLHLGESLAPPTALKRAQAWLRNATKEDLLGYVKSAAARAKLGQNMLADLEQSLSTLRRRSSRFAATWNTLHTRSADGPAKSPPDVGGSVVGPLARPFAHPFYWGGFVYTGI